MNRLTDVPIDTGLPSLHTDLPRLRKGKVGAQVSEAGAYYYFYSLEWCNNWLSGFKTNNSSMYKVEKGAREWRVREPWIVENHNTGKYIENTNLLKYCQNAKIYMNMHKRRFFHREKLCFCFQSIEQSSTNFSSLASGKIWMRVFNVRKTTTTVWLCVSFFLVLVCLRALLCSAQKCGRHDPRANWRHPKIYREVSGRLRVCHHCARNSGCSQEQEDCVIGWCRGGPFYWQ